MDYPIRMGLSQRSLKRVWSWISRSSIAARLLGAFVLLLVIGIFAWQIENYRGARRLALAKARLADEMMSWDWRDYHRKPSVPTERNLAHQPPFKDLDVFPVGTGYGVDIGAAVEPLFEGLPPELGIDGILQATQHLEPRIQELHDALQMEACEWMPLNYDRMHSAPVPQIGDFTKSSQKLAKLLCTRAEAYLDSGDPDKASRELFVVIKFVDIMRFEPSLVGSLTRSSLSAQIVSDPTWHRLLTHENWSDEALLKLQQAIAPIDLLGHLESAMEAELAGVINAMTASMNAEPWMDDGFRVGLRIDLRHIGPDQWLGHIERRFRSYFHNNLPRWMPRGWHGQNGARVIEWYDKCILSIYDSKKQRVYLKGAVNTEINRAPATPYSFIAKRFIPQVSDIAQSVAKSQTNWDLLRLTCALQRYHLQYGAYPENLETLVEDGFIKQLPHDYLSGDRPTYERAGQAFSLASQSASTL